MHTFWKNLALISLALFSCAFFPVAKTEAVASYELFPATIQEIKTDPRDPQSKRLIVSPNRPDLPKQLDLTSTNLSEHLSRTLQVGDQLIVENFQSSPQEAPSFSAVDLVRNQQILILFAIFLVLSIGIGRKRGILSLITMLISFLIIIHFTIKQISAGQDPVLIAIISAFILIPINFFITHGKSKKVIAAAISTCIAMIIGIVLANVFVNWSRLTGLSSDETFWITQTFSEINNFRGLVIASIVLGSIGILDDVTIAQSSTVEELIKSHSVFDAKKIFRQAMNIGRDHLASMVNTLILVYASASLPLFVLFSNNIGDVTSLINLETITEEIIRSLVSSIALIIAIPISTWFAVKMLSPRKSIKNGPIV